MLNPRPLVCMSTSSDFKLLNKYFGFAINDHMQHKYAIRYLNFMFCHM